MLAPAAKREEGGNMWLLRYLFFSVVLGVFGLTLLLFLGQNQHTERLDFFGLEYTTNMVWVLVGAAVFGVLITLALLLPGRIAITVHGWSLEREVRQLEQGLVRLQEQRERVLARQEQLLEAHERVLQSYQRLVAEHGRVVAERDRVRSQLAAATPTPAPALSTATAAPVAIREHTTVPRLAIAAPLAAGTASVAAVLPRPNSAPDGSVPPAPVTVSPRSVLPVPGRAHDVAREAGHDTTPPTRPASADLRPAAVEHSRIPVVTGRAEVEPADNGSQGHTAPTAAPTPPSPSLPVPAAVASADRPAPTHRLATILSASDLLARQVAALPGRVRDQLQEDISGISTLLAAKWIILEAKLAQVKQSVLPGGPSSGTPDDHPRDKDQG